MSKCLLWKSKLSIVIISQCDNQCTIQIGGSDTCTCELFPSEPLRRRGVCDLSGLLLRRQCRTQTLESYTLTFVKTQTELSSQTCYTGSFLWSCFCPTRVGLRAAFSPRRRPGWTWGFAPGFPGGWQLETQSRCNAARPRNLTFKTNTGFRHECWWTSSALLLMAFTANKCHAS